MRFLQDYSPAAADRPRFGADDRLAGPDFGATGEPLAGTLRELATRNIFAPSSTIALRNKSSPSADLSSSAAEPDPRRRLSASQRAASRAPANASRSTRIACHLSD